jgi:hypothetical protein
MKRRIWRSFIPRWAFYIERLGQFADENTTNGQVN